MEEGVLQGDHHPALPAQVVRGLLAGGGVGKGARDEAVVQAGGLGDRQGSADHALRVRPGDAGRDGGGIGAAGDGAGRVWVGEVESSIAAAAASSGVTAQMPMGETRISEPLLWLLRSAARRAASALPPMLREAGAREAGTREAGARAWRVVVPMSKGREAYRAP